MIEIAVATVLILLNGLFALSELAVVSSRPARLRALLRAGRPGAAVALDLAQSPGRFLSAVQVGITVVGLVAGAFSGAALSHRLAGFFQGLGADQVLAEGLGFGLTIAVLTYLSVIIGELIPKHLALRQPERIACRVAPPMQRFSSLAAPLIWLLDASTQVLLRMLGQELVPKQAVTDEEIKALLADAAAAGTIANAEREMMAGIMRLGDRKVKGIMTPRTDVQALDLSADESALRGVLMQAHHGIMPVVEGSLDNIVGVVQLRELFSSSIKGDPLSLRASLRNALVVPGTMEAVAAIEALRSAEIPMALVYDEYGHFEGLITPTDALKAIVGAFRTDADGSGPEAVQRADGSWLLDGSLPADEMADLLDLSLPDQRSFETVAGLVIEALRHLPVAGETVETLGYRFEVMDTDARRVDKVLATRLRPSRDQ